MLVFMKNFHIEACPSQQTLMDLTDKLGKEIFGIDCDFTYDSKAHTINEMIRQNILKKDTKSLKTPIMLTERTRKIIEEGIERYATFLELTSEE